MKNRGKNAISTSRRNERFYKVAPDKEVDIFYKQFVEEHGSEASLVHFCNTADRMILAKKKTMSILMSRKVKAGSLLKETASRQKASAQYRLKTEAANEPKTKDLEGTKPPSFLESSSSKLLKSGSKKKNTFLKPMPRLEPTLCQTESSNPIFSSSQKVKGLQIEASSPKSITSEIQAKIKAGDQTERTNLSRNNNISQQQKSKHNLRETNGSIESTGVRTGLLFDRKKQSASIAPLAHMNNLRLDSQASEEENETHLFLKK